MSVCVHMLGDKRFVMVSSVLISHVREVHGHVTLVLYSALMKVYSHAWLYHKTCNMCEAMKRDEVGPDTVI